MALVNPVAYIQASSHPADVFRRVVRALRPSPGVRLPTDLAVTANGTPNMTINVAAGEAIIDGNQNVVSQGSYASVLNDAVVNLAIAASDPTNPRIDLVVVAIQDAAYSGAANQSVFQVVTGTPAPSPAAPVAPANSLILAQIAVAANATTIIAGNITDRRTYLWQVIQPGSTGVHIRNSTNARDNLALDDNGFMILSGAVSVPPAFGTALPPSTYGTLPVKIDEQSPTSGTSVTISVPSWARKIQVDWCVRSGMVANSDILRVQFNGDTTATYNWVRSVLIGTYASTGPQNGSTQGEVALVPGANSVGGIFDSGTFELYTPNVTGRRRQWKNGTSRNDAGVAATGPEFSAGDWNNTANAITSLALFLATGPYVSGCSFVTTAYP